MLNAIKGKFRDGKIELAETPNVIGEADVIVTFLTGDLSVGPEDAKPIAFGMLSNPARRQSTLQDFKDGEFDDSAWGRE